MTDAEPAPSCTTQFQVKFRPGSQVIVLTSFPFAFSSLVYCPEDTIIILHLLPFIQGSDAGDDIVSSTAGSLL